PRPMKIPLSATLANFQSEAGVVADHMVYARATVPIHARSDMEDTSQQPLVSAVICTRNRPDKIGHAVESILTNIYPNFDLTVIDQSTNDETESIVRRIGEREGRIRYQRMNKSGLSRAYNLAIASTTGQYVAFTDDDCIVPTDWIEKIVKAFEDQRDGELMYG